MSSREIQQHRNVVPRRRPPQPSLAPGPFGESQNNLAESKAPDIRVERELGLLYMPTAIMSKASDVSEIHAALEALKTAPTAPDAKSAANALAKLVQEAGFCSLE